MQRSQSMTITLTQDDLYTMLLSTVRYSLGRQTYITGVCRDLIERYAGLLTPPQRVVLRRDIADAMERHDALGGGLGMSCDVDAWRGALAFLDAKQGE